MAIYLGSDRSTPNLDQIMTGDVAELHAWMDERKGHDLSALDFGFYLGIPDDQLRLLPRDS
jgi:hypothetical protein